jgi:nucleotidyltransferase substrate binding protein (TIGR01987 family)
VGAAKGASIMNAERLKERLEEYRRAVVRLKEAVEEDESNPLIYDAVIQRFEFTYELAWKLIKAYLEYQGMAVVNLPRSAFKEAFAAGLIFDGDAWIDMISDRNLTAHTYNEERAREIYARVREKYLDRFVALASRMEELIK